MIDIQNWAPTYAETLWYVRWKETTLL